MKKLLITSCIASTMVLIGISTANAIELKAPGVAGLKVVPTATSNSSAKSATNEKYQKEYQAKLAEQSKKLEAVKSYDKAARLELANVILTSEQITEIKETSISFRKSDRPHPPVRDRCKHAR